MRREFYDPMGEGLADYEKLKNDVAACVFDISKGPIDVNMWRVTKKVREVATVKTKIGAADCSRLGGRTARSADAPQGHGPVVPCELLPLSGAEGQEGRDDHVEPLHVPLRRSRELRHDGRGALRNVS